MKEIKEFLRKNKYIALIYCVALVVLTFFNILPGNDDYDTYYYFHALNGQIDCLRTPIYPIFLQFCSFLPGHVNLYVTIFQSIIYLISIYYFYLICSQTFDSVVSLICCLLYVISPIPAWCNTIMTECISISLLVINLYYIIKQISNPSLKIAILNCFITIVLVFLRPTFIILLVFLPILWFALFIKSRNKHFCHSLLLSLVPLLLFCGYSLEYKKQYGKFSTTISYECNSIFNLKRSKLWDPSCLEDPEEIEVCNFIDTYWDGAYRSIYNWANTRKNIIVIDKMCKTMIDHHKQDYTYYRIKKSILALDSHLSTCTVSKRNSPFFFMYATTSLLTFHIGFIILVFLLGCLIQTIMFMKGHGISVTYLFLNLLGLGYSLGIMYAATDSFGRLILPAYPLFILTLGFVITDSLLLIKGQSRQS